MRFIVDANLPPCLAQWLVERGHQAIFTDDVLGIGAADHAIVDLATVRGDVIVSKDRDFKRLVQDPPPPQLVWVTLGNTVNSRLLEVFEQQFTDVLAVLQAGALVVEIPVLKDRP